MTKIVKDRLYLKLSIDKDLYNATTKTGVDRYNFVSIGFARFYGDEAGSASIFNFTFIFASLSVGWLFK